MKIRKLLTIPGLVAFGAIPTMTIVGCGQKIQITDLQLSGASSYEIGIQSQIKTTITPANATNKKLQWSVDDTTKATINDEGLITLTATGDVTVTAKTTDGSDITRTITITIVEPTVSTETYKEYIYNRTFSIVSIVQTGPETAGSVWGTAWVLSDATPSITNDYKYYIATNWHVIKGQEDLIEQAYQGKYAMRFGCGDSSTGVKITDTVKFTSFNPIAQANFTYDNSTKITTTETTESGGTQTKTGLKGCDVYVVEADFGDFTTQTERASSAIAKAKLDKLNALTVDGKKITRLAPTTSDALHFESKSLYTGGYPYKSSLSGPKWEYHDLSEAQGTQGETVELEYKSQSSVETDKITHWADNHDSPMTDCSPQYAYKGTGYFEDWMTGGASGSMLIANFGTDEAPLWRVVGIYWGGQGYKSGDHQYIQPYFSIFNSDWKNYLSQWDK